MTSSTSSLLRIDTIGAEQGVRYSEQGKVIQMHSIVFRERAHSVAQHTSAEAVKVPVGARLALALVEKHRGSVEAAIEWLKTEAKFTQCRQADEKEQEQEIAACQQVYSQESLAAWRELLNLLSTYGFGLITPFTHYNVGFGLFTGLAAKVNHSCGANCAYTFELVVNDDDLTEIDLVVHAIRDIQPGEEITFSYLPWVDILPYAERQHQLQSVMRFQCTCTRCVSESVSTDRTEALVELYPAQTLQYMNLVNPERRKLRHRIAHSQSSEAHMADSATEFRYVYEAIKCGCAHDRYATVDRFSRDVIALHLHSLQYDLRVWIRAALCIPIDNIKERFTTTQLKQHFEWVVGLRDVFRLDLCSFVGLYALAHGLLDQPVGNEASSFPDASGMMFWFKFIHQFLHAYCLYFHNVALEPSQPVHIASPFQLLYSQLQTESRIPFHAHRRFFIFFAVMLNTLNKSRHTETVAQVRSA